MRRFSIVTGALAAVVTASALLAPVAAAAPVGNTPDPGADQNAGAPGKPFEKPGIKPVSKPAVHDATAEVKPGIPSDARDSAEAEHAASHPDAMKPAKTGPDEGNASDRDTAPADRPGKAGPEAMAPDGVHGAPVERSTTSTEAKPATHTRPGATQADPDAMHVDKPVVHPAKPVGDDQAFTPEAKPARQVGGQAQGGEPAAQPGTMRHSTRQPHHIYRPWGQSAHPMPGYRPVVRPARPLPADRALGHEPSSFPAAHPAVHPARPMADDRALGHEPGSLPAERPLGHEARPMPAARPVTHESHPMPGYRQTPHQVHPAQAARPMTHQAPATPAQEPTTPQTPTTPQARSAAQAPQAQVEAPMTHRVRQPHHVYKPWGQHAQPSHVDPYGRPTRTWNDSTRPYPHAVKPTTKPTAKPTAKPAAPATKPVNEESEPINPSAKSGTDSDPNVYSGGPMEGPTGLHH